MYLPDSLTLPAAEAEAIRQRCHAKCLSEEFSCISADAWSAWEPPTDIWGNDFELLNEPSPICAIFPGMLFDCGNGATAEEIEACVMGIQQEQAKFHCP